MARKPSERSSSGTDPVELNITPYLDIVTSIMLFMMVTSTGLVQMGVINVNAPRYADPLDSGSMQQDKNQKDPEKKLNLTVGITYKGLFVAGVGGVLGADTVGDSGEGSATRPTIPLLTVDHACQDAIAKGVPPPASCYDYSRLTLEMVKIKNQFPKESKIIIYAQPDVPYEILVNIMDATRQDSNGRAMFFDVILSPEIS